MENTQLNLDQLRQISGGGESLGDVASEVYNDAKSIAVFYGKWAGGVAGGKSWDRAALEAGQEAGIPGLDEGGDEGEEK